MQTRFRKPMPRSQRILHETFANLVEYCYNLLTMIKEMLAFKISCGISQPSRIVRYLHCRILRNTYRDAYNRLVIRYRQQEYRSRQAITDELRAVARQIENLRYTVLLISGHCTLPTIHEE